MAETTGAYRSIDSWQNISKTETESIDLDVLTNEFEERWRHFRKERIVVEDQTGIREIAIYALPVDQFRTKSKSGIIDFAKSALLLGYRPTLNSVLLPADDPSLFNGYPKNMEVLFFLERNLPSRKQEV